MLSLFKKLFRSDEPVESTDSWTDVATIIAVPKSAPQPPKKKTASLSHSPSSQTAVRVSVPGAPEPKPAQAGEETLELPLAPIVERLAEACRAAVATQPAPGTTLRLPIPELHEQLKRGVVKVTFGALRHAAPAGVFVSNTSEQDRLFVEIPLKIVLPKVALALRPNQRVISAPDEAVPGFNLKARTALEPQGDETVPEPPVTAPRTLKFEPPAEIPVSPAPVRPEPAPSPEPEDLAPLLLEIDLEDFSDDSAEPAVPAEAGGPTRPDEVLESASSLPGVDGALLASHDGLVIESRVSLDVDPQVLAAFLPETWVRTRIYLTEMNLATQSSITVRIGDQTLEIWEVGSLYFAALSTPGSALPGQELRALTSRIATFETAA